MTRPKHLLCIALAAAALLLPQCCPANNPFGIMVMTDGSADTAGMLHHLKLARELVGEWGYVRIGGSFEQPQVTDVARTILGCRALHLIPVLTAMRLPASYYDPSNRDLPLRDADGSLASFENAYEQWARALYQTGVTIPYLEYGNEINGGFFGEHPEVYGQSVVAASRGLKKVDSRISFGTAGMAGCARDFYDKLLTRLPELVDHVDHWGFHPYAANHPPGYGTSEDDYSIECHRFLADTLKKHGVADPVFIASETGFELGNQRDRRFPKITEDLRARYLVEGYERYWLPDTSVRAIMPFMLQDVRWSNWNGWDFVRDDYSLTPVYQAIRDLPKPKGEDYLPTGPCSITGKIEGGGSGVEDVIVWVRKAGGLHYAAVTGADGEYTIASIPEGSYTIAAVRDGFEAPADATVTVGLGSPAVWNASLKPVGYLPSFHASAGSQVPDGWTTLTSDSVYEVDQATKRSGNPSVRIVGNGKEQGIWKVTTYESVLPGRAYEARVWVRASAGSGGKPPAARLELSAVDSYNRTLDTVSVPASGAGPDRWQEVAALIRPRATARRLRVRLVTEAGAGAVWFADASCRPVRPDSPTSSSAPLTGIVLGPDGQARIADATVFLSPSGRWTTSDNLGRFFIGPAGPSDNLLVVSAQGYQSTADALTDSRSGLLVKLGLPEAPPAIDDPGFEIVPQISTWFTGWNRWGTTEGVHKAGSFKGLPEHPDGFQPHSGNGFYAAVAGSNIKDGGIYRTLSCEPDAPYEVSVWSYTFQTGEGGIRGDATNRLGIDPTGGSDPGSPYLIWTPHRPSHKKWSKVSLKVRPVGDRMTIFLHHQQVVGLLYVCNLFDDVSVRKVGPPVETLDSD